MTSKREPGLRAPLVRQPRWPRRSPSASPQRSAPHPRRSPFNRKLGQDLLVGRRLAVLGSAPAFEEAADEGAEDAISPAVLGSLQFKGPLRVGRGHGLQTEGRAVPGGLLGAATRGTEVWETEGRPRAASRLGPGARSVGGGGEALASPGSRAQAQQPRAPLKCEGAKGRPARGSELRGAGGARRTRGAGRGQGWEH